MEQKSFVDRFIEIEDKLCLFDVEVNNVNIWNYIRTEVAYDLIEINTVSSLHEPLFRFDVKREMDFKQLFQKLFFANQFLARKRDLLVIPHGRRFRSKGLRYKDIYTDNLCKALNHSYYLLDYGDVYKGWLPIDNRNLLFLDMDSFCKRNGVVFDQKLEKAVIIDKIFDPLEKMLQINITGKMRNKWLKIAYKSLLIREIYMEYFDYLLSRIKPSAIIIVCYYSADMMAVCEVSKKKGIPVIELQHGTINEQTISYNYYKKMEMNSFPDYIFTYGDYARCARFPIADYNIIPVGFPELENSIKTKQLTNKKKIVFISAMSREIALFAKNLSEIVDQSRYSIIFRLHPSEVSTWGQQYAGFLDIKRIIIDDASTSAYECLDQADWVVGISSSTLIDAIMFNVKIAIIRTGEYKYLAPLYENGCAVLVDDVNQLYTEIESDYFIPQNSEYFFKKGSINNMIRAIDDIIMRDLS